MPKKKKKINKGKSYNKAELKKKVLGVFSSYPTRTFNYKQVAKKLDIKDSSSRRLLVQYLEQLKEDDNLTEQYTGKYKLKRKGGFVIGKVDLTAYGSAFVEVENLEEDIFVAQANLNHAMQGDTVKVFLYAKRGGRRPEGEITEVLERARTSFVGIIQVSGKFAFVVSERKKLPYDIYISPDKLNGAKNGEKVVVRICDWPENVKNPFGEVVEVLGKPGENEVEMHAILAEFELPYKFRPEILKAADKIPGNITKKEIASRRDMRDIPTLTIDPEDAKDFDDALSVRRLESGNIEVGVHIADVTHYIQPGSMLDEEAFERATSVYLVDRVVPMLPERLSNELCSLRPNEEKLTFSAVFEINEKAEIVGSWFGRTVIYSDRRFTYEQAQAVIEGGEGEMKEEILHLHKLAQILRENRFKKGSFEFERVEVKFRIDEKGTPLGVFFKENKESNQLVEEFMLLANKGVAELVNIYRIHDKPDPEKLESFSRIAAKFGHKLPVMQGSGVSKGVNTILKDVQGKKEQHIIETLAVRSMAKAVYSPHNIGHYGLGFKDYTHFTSPIRRYPDMIVHRILADKLQGGKLPGKNKLEKQAQHCSTMEKKAADAERASIKYKQVEFLSDKIGECFSGIISGVVDWGLYVEIEENKCEGLVPIRELDDDYYEFDEENFLIKGKRTGKAYQLGESVNVEIGRANLPKKQLDLFLIDHCPDQEKD